MLEITKELNKIQGLYVEKIHHSGQVDSKVEIKVIFEEEKLSDSDGNNGEDTETLS